MHKFGLKLGTTPNPDSAPSITQFFHGPSWSKGPPCRLWGGSLKVLKPYMCVCVYEYKAGIVGLTRFFAFSPSQKTQLVFPPQATACTTPSPPPTDGSRPWRLERAAAKQEAALVPGPGTVV